MDVLRHAGAAELAEFVGATPDNVAHGPGAAALAPTTPRRRRRPRSPRRPRGTAPRAASCCGASTRSSPASTPPQDGAVPGAAPPAAPNCPAEYAALQKSRSRGPAPTSSTSPRWSAASSARAAAGRSPTRSWLQQLSQFGARRGAADLRRPAREERPGGADHRQHARAVRRRAGRPGAARRRAAGPRRARPRPAPARRRRHAPRRCPGRRAAGQAAQRRLDLPPGRIDRPQRAPTG